MQPGPAPAPPDPDPEVETLRCMEIWGGNEAITRQVRLPGIDAWVFSRPHEDAEGGGDVHFVSLCGGGLITRLVVADVSGHGAKVADFARSLRDLVRRNINRKSQDRLVRDLNREFGDFAQARRFATAIVATYLANTDRLTLHNAGHPRPLLYRARDARWEVVATPEPPPSTPADPDEGPADLPFGLDEATPYRPLELTLAPGDLLVFYTDAITEARAPAGGLLGEEGLLALIQPLDRADPMTLGPALLAAVERLQGGPLDDDDLTLLILHHHGGPPRRAGPAEKLAVYAKVFGLKPV